MIAWWDEARYHLDLYRRLLGVQIRSQAQYRWPFVLDMLGSLMGTIVSFVSLALVFERFGNLGGWTLAEVALLYGMVETAFGLMDMLFSGFDPPNFGRQVRLGRLDQILLRPVSVTLQVLGSEFIIRRTGRILQGVAVLLLALSWLDLAWTPLKLVYFPIVLLSMTAFFGGLFIVGATITFWTIDSIEVINIFTYGGTELVTYPMHIYPNPLRRFFTYIIPAAFLNYYPALYLLGKPDPFGLPPFAPFLAPLAGFGVLAAALAFWQYGLKFYQSSGT